MEQLIDPKTPLSEMLEEHASIGITAGDRECYFLPYWFELKKESSGKQVYSAHKLKAPGELADIIKYGREIIQDNTTHGKDPKTDKPPYGKVVLLEYFGGDAYNDERGVTVGYLKCTDYRGDQYKIFTYNGEEHIASETSYYSIKRWREIPDDV